jgi:hypothetical protein
MIGNPNGSGTRRATGMPAIARTRDEALLYLDLHPCRTCGSINTAWESTLVPAADPAPPPGLAIRYWGSCVDCGTDREALFALPGHETTPEGYPAFGGPEPSQLLDAGEWLRVADLTTDDPPPGEERHAGTIAAAAIEEVLKFIPAGEDEVPITAFWTAGGMQALDAEPGRFTRRWLTALRDSYTGRNNGTSD